MAYQDDPTTKADTSMKVNLVVATGVHQGKVVPILGPEFLVGRDPQCQLRPASQAVSKQHCAVIIRDGQVYIRDFGSTNGTIVNGNVIWGDEVLVASGDSVKIGPLDFTLQVEIAESRTDGTPLPDVNPESAAALAAIKSAGATPPGKNATPRPTTAKPGPKDVVKKPGSKESPALTGSKEAAALQAKTGSKETAALKPTTESSLAGSSSGDEESDKLAAMLLGLDDGPVEVPEGSTVADMPPIEGAAGMTKPEDKKDPKKIISREETSNAASEILRKYMRRPK
jgi:predicted component of type VI protein secretion system